MKNADLIEMTSKFPNNIDLGRAVRTEILGRFSNDEGIKKLARVHPNDYRFGSALRCVAAVESIDPKI